MLSAGDKHLIPLARPWSLQKPHPIIYCLIQGNRWNGQINIAGHLSIKIYGKKEKKRKEKRPTK